jgi:hypothetical protein
MVAALGGQRPRRSGEISGLTQHNPFIYHAGRVESSLTSGAVRAILALPGDMHDVVSILLILAVFGALAAVVRTVGRL